MSDQGCLTLTGYFGDGAALGSEPPAARSIRNLVAAVELEHRVETMSLGRMLAEAFADHQSRHRIPEADLGATRRLDIVGHTAGNGQLDVASWLSIANEAACYPELGELPAYLRNDIESAAGLFLMADHLELFISTIRDFLIADDREEDQTFELRLIGCSFGAVGSSALPLYQDPGVLVWALARAIGHEQRCEVVVKALAEDPIAADFGSTGYEKEHSNWLVASSKDACIPVGHNAPIWTPMGMPLFAL